MISRKCIWLAVLLLCTAACSKKEEQPPAEKTAKPEQIAADIQVANLSPSLDSAVIGFFSAMDRKDTLDVKKRIFQYNEYVSIYPFTLKADMNPESPAFIAGLFDASNRKHLSRWIYEYNTKNLTFSRYTVEKPAEQNKGFEYIKGIRLFVKNEKGEEEEFPVFKTIAKLKGGYKIWSILDT